MKKSIQPQARDRSTRDLGADGWLYFIIALVSMILLFRYKINSTWLIAGGALAGLLISFVQ